MDLENQKRVKEFADQYGPVYHVCEPEIKDEFDANVYDEQVSMMEMVLDVDDIVNEMSSIREQFCKF